MIATVDKFASLPWTGETGALFGHVERYDQYGFYSRATPGIGQPLDCPLPPIDLIIQDELHLISGPLGTIAGVYEAAIDALAMRTIEQRRVRPKIIASTATVRRAASQIRALFDRQEVMIFPPPGPDRRDSFFSHTQPAGQTPARHYIGIAAQGRSHKVIMLRAALAILSAGQTLYNKEGGRKNVPNPVDPYMTLLGYFNSLRELGGSRRIIEDEVRMKLEGYSKRKRIDPQDTLFSDRTIDYEVLELTSRVKTNDVAAAKRRLALPFGGSEKVDVAFATNMISVGLDIVRLGLMMVNGQPKTSAEYIQATSRVGRDPQRPGLVITILNVHKSRDRSHFERFENYHTSFYRAVEPTSVTPFSPRALDRALVAGLVGLSRHLVPDMTPPLGAGKILRNRSALEAVAEAYAQRAQGHDARLTAVEARKLCEQIRSRCRDALDEWHTIADRLIQTNTQLKYQRWEPGQGRRLLYDLLDPELADIPASWRKFKAGRSMREVEPGVCVDIKNLNAW